MVNDAVVIEVIGEALISNKLIILNKINYGKFVPSRKLKNK